MRPPLTPKSMKAFLKIFLAALLFTSFASADQKLGYPQKKPLLTFSVPDDWKPQYKSGSLFVLPPDDDSVIIEVTALQAPFKNLKSAVKEAKDTVSDFQNLTFKKGAGTEGDDLKDGLKVTVLNGKGEDKHGPAIINLLILGSPSAGKNFLLSAISSQEGFEKMGAVIGNILGSMAAKGAPKVAPFTSQTFSYPNKETMEFSIDFPADWKMELTDEGCYVESPDKLIPANVLLIDMADVKIAREDMKKKVGAGYNSIEWNEGARPKVHDWTEELGYTVTFDNAVAMDGDVKYSVNFVQYERKGSGKFMLLLFQQPIAALDKHGDEMQNIIQSVKVKR